MKSAMGMVAAMVNVPQGLPLSAFTTTSATTASRMIMISRTVIKRGESADFADLFAGHLAERFAVAAHGAEQDHEILHGAAEHRADDDPERAGQIAELRGERGADQRTGAGDGGEMVAEDDPFIGGLEIVAVAQTLGGGGALVVEDHHSRGDEFCVEAESDGVGAGGGHDQPDAVNGFTAIGGDSSKAEGGDERYEAPEDVAGELHFGSLTF